MPTAILKFKLPEERDDFHYAMRGSVYIAALWNLATSLRNKYKYGDEPNTTWSDVHDLFYVVLRDSGIPDLDEEAT